MSFTLNGRMFEGLDLLKISNSVTTDLSEFSYEEGREISIRPISEKDMRLSGKIFREIDGDREFSIQLDFSPEPDEPLFFTKQQDPPAPPFLLQVLCSQSGQITDDVRGAYLKWMIEKVSREEMNHFIEQLGAD